MIIRIDKFLSNMGEGTRNEIKKIIKQGYVTVDGNRIKQYDIKIDTSQNIEINKRQIIYKKYIYLMMNKPKDVISATNDDKCKTVIDLLDEEFRKFNLFPVGRLDKDTEGLILLTNDGELSHNLLSPKKHIPKTYYAKIYGILDKKYIDIFKYGIILDDGYKTLPSELKIIKSDSISEIEITITEGKYHQVKRMFEATNNKVIYLKRISMGKLILDENISLGEYRELTEKEINMIKIRTDNYE